jgi:hypothetical protein
MICGEMSKSIDGRSVAVSAARAREERPSSSGGRGYSGGRSRY